MFRLTEILGTALLAAALSVLPVRALAASDIDGAIDAFFDTGFNTFGDLAGSTGLIFGGLTGLLGDGVSMVDDNKYLRGILSTPIRRFGLSISNTFTGMLEGLRSEDLKRYPEAPAVYLEAQESSVRIDSVMDGIGGIYVGISDLTGNPLLVILRAAGATERSDAISDWQMKVRDRYFGPMAGK